MIKNAEKAKIKFFFGAPSCVPATSFESTGSVIDPEDIEFLFKRFDLKFLSEMMNYPGVISKNKNILDKLEIAKKYNKKIDGHAPGLKGDELDLYLEEGIDTDHECSSYDEALEKIKKGMTIQIREGSAAKNFFALSKLIDQYPDKVLLCSDDLHPDDLVKGHINILIQYGIKENLDLFNLLKTATFNPIKHYNLNVGLLRARDPADFIVVENLEDFVIKQTYINGELVYQKDKKLIRVFEKNRPNKFNARKIIPEDLFVPDKNTRIKVINVCDGTLITTCSYTTLPTLDGFLQTEIDNDILKITVVNRYERTHPAVAFIHNFGLKSGAIASSIAHDSHNIIAVGTDDNALCNCINWIIEHKGGISVFDGNRTEGIPLPIAGIMSDNPAEWVAEKYNKLNSITRDMGCKFSAPFMTLSFMSLLVIPELKLSDKGLFDSKNFEFTSLYINNSKSE